MFIVFNIFSIRCLFSKVSPHPYWCQPTATTSFHLVLTSHFSHFHKDSNPTVPKHLSAFTHKASRTTTATDIRVVSSKPPGTDTAPREPQASSDCTQATHNGQSWHGDARPMSPTSGRVGSGRRVVQKSGGVRWEKQNR